MVLILVILTIVVFLAIELALEERRAERSNAPASDWAATTAKKEPVRTDPVRPAGLLFHPGHTWARSLPGGLVAVGADDFATGFIGRAAAVSLPAAGATLVQGQPAWTVVSAKGRRLSLAAPITGEVVAVAKQASATRAESPPATSRWTLLMRPSLSQPGFANLLEGISARAWLAAIRDALATRHTSLGVVSPDGGTWHPQFGDTLDDQTWNDVRNEFFPAPHEPIAGTGKTRPPANGDLNEEWR
jgi:glycine cleavage system H lipoate-binding protein